MARHGWFRWSSRIPLKNLISRLTDSGVRLGGEQLDLLWPFHVIFQDGLATHVGPGLTKCLEGAGSVGSAMQDFLQLAAPEDLGEVDWRHPQLLLDRPLDLRSLNGHAFSGELQPLSPNGWLLILQPIAQSIQDLHGYGLTLQDLSLSDPLRQHVLPALLNEGLQQLLLEEACHATGSNACAADEAAWLDLRLGS